MEIGIHFFKTWQIMCRNLSGLSFFRIIECRLGKYMRQKGSFKFTVRKHSVWKSLKMSHFQKLAKIDCFGIFYELLFIQNVNVARFARKVEWDFFWDFQTLCRKLVHIYLGRWSLKSLLRFYCYFLHSFGDKYRGHVVPISNFTGFCN